MPIPPVNKDGLQDEDQALPLRPEWMKWYYDRWNDATVFFDSEQKGWYMNLLMYAASKGTPPGYIRKDEPKLKQIAGFTDLPQDVVNILGKGVNSNSDPIINQIRQMRLQRWLQVRAKFLDSNTVNGYVYNKRLVETLREAYQRHETRRIAGQEGAKKRWNSTKGKSNKDDIGKSMGDLFTEELRTAPTDEEHALPLELLEQKDLMAIQDSLDTRKNGITNGFAIHEPLTPLESTPSTENSIFQDVVNSINNSTKLIRRRTKNETLFDEDRFKITMEMYEHLKKKYPEFEQGDFDHLEEKFKNVYYGKKYRSWKRAFYNFITNQVVLYGYKPGAFNWRQNSPTPQEGKPQYESAAERTDRLEREAEEYTRGLRGRGHGDSPEGEEALPLSTDDLG